MNLRRLMDPENLVIWNIVDERKRHYRWKVINAFIESVDHDNSCEDADQAPSPKWDSERVDYDQRIGISVTEAVEWAHKHPAAVTLYLWDEGEGLSEITALSRVKSET